MIVQINYNQGEEKSTELIHVDAKDLKLLKKASKKYNKEGCPRYFLDYLKTKRIDFKKVIPDEEIEV